MNDIIIKFDKTIQTSLVPIVTNQQLLCYKPTTSRNRSMSLPMIFSLCSKYNCVKI